MPFPYQHSNGGICCSSQDGCCPRCKEKLAAENLRLNQRDTIMENDYTPPNPYAIGITALRAAMATPLSTFEDGWKADRLRELAADETFTQGNGLPGKPFADRTEDFEPPNGYALALAALKENR